MKTFFKKFRLKTYHFYSKLLCQKPMLRQIERRLQNGPIPKSGVLPVTTLFFWKTCFSFRTSLIQLIWCTNDPNVHIHIFRKRWSIILGSFFPVSILKGKRNIFQYHLAHVWESFIIHQVFYILLTLVWQHSSFQLTL